ncbi:hypothetical protein [Natronorubrum thiooxidans]|uniref:DUF7975 domain-containing protein n=1 Tax=Natronorubrum thiooxidans TaxID=308853 RepID=A0A1N7DZA6_9EURY|nr:hypothetical protein [Natronorubrum thiooxidans]SIR81128.1 hypothetical protein SAMN05421752_10354 [Natronorubrum thiooxidans]
MTRFDAAEPAKRQQLYVDAITAHRHRGSGFLTLEVDDAVLESVDDGPSIDGSEGDTDGEHDDPEPELGVPWIQFGDGTINLDCTDSELETLKSVLREFPAFKIDEIHRPEEAEGVNVHISAKADPNRIAQCLDTIFQRVYELPADVRIWVVEL